MTKYCPTCQGTKTLSAFNADSRTPDSHARLCRACARAAGTAYRSRNLDSVRHRERINAELYRLRHPQRRRYILAESARRRRVVKRALEGTNR